MTRREILVAALAATAARAAGKTEPTFVLVHGAWHGGWCWAEVIALLKERGHTAVAPTLTGLAERAKELSAEVNLTTHVDDVVKACDGLEHVILVGHSYGGLVISAAVDRLAPKLDRLVYLDAFLPEPGQCGFDLMKKEYGQHWKERAKGGPGVPPMLSAKAMGVTDEKRAKEVDAKLTPHPLATFEEKVQFDLEKWKGLKKSYLRAAKYSGFGPTAVRAKKEGLEVQELDSGHDVMLAAPAALAAALDRMVTA
ncbi:MAG: alpha/beta hydrolase family protein [Myxococcaceae bacterium]